MGHEFKISKTTILIILFLFLFGISIQVFRSNYLLRLHTGNAQVANEVIKHTSALSLEEKLNFEQEKILLIYDPELAESKSLMTNLVKTLEYMKKVYEVIPVSQIPNELSNFQNIMIAFSDLDEVGNFSLLTNYVSEGGKLFFAVRPYPGDVYLSIYQKLGIYETDNTYQDATGIELVSDLLLKGENLKIDQDFIANSSLSVRLKNSSKVYARSIKGLPLLWSTSYGKGTMMVFNGTMLGSKLNRGLIAGSLSYLNDDFIYPIMNSKVVYIDDFPAPFPEGNNEAIYVNYKRDIPTFFRDIWWPDMVQVAAKQDLKYTGVLIETYDDKVKAPFDDRLVKENLKIYGRELIKMGGEVGVHGYNHQSLTKDQNQVRRFGYHAWEDEKEMVESLNEVKQLFSELFPDYTIRTYVPPSNVLSEDGKKAIREAIPSIKNIASLYHEDIRGIAYVQEYESSADFIELPRLSSDYHFKDENKWIIANSSTLLGVFSHFIHPDDVLDKERSNSDGWSELLKEYSEMMHSVKDKYPWMESQTASESASRLQKLENSDVFISQKSDIIKVYINHFAGELDFILRSDKTLTKNNGCDIEKISDDRYLVRAHSDKFEIVLGEKP